MSMMNPSACKVWPASVHSTATATRELSRPLLRILLIRASKLVSFKGATALSSIPVVEDSARLGHATHFLVIHLLVLRSTSSTISSAYECFLTSSMQLRTQYV